MSGCRPYFGRHIDAKAAVRFGIDGSTAGAWMRGYRETGEIAARKQGQPGGSKLDVNEAVILGLVADRH